MTNTLIPLTLLRSNGAAKSAAGRPRATFLAHLIATAKQVPQTRLRGRVAPIEATAAYRALGQWPTPPGGALTRSL